MTQLIDYSQTSSFYFCPWLWYEKYVRRMSRRWVGQRSDQLCLGSLVHEGLDAWAKTGRVAIRPEVLAEQDPTPDTYQLAMLLAVGWTERFPAERWPVERTEEPLRWKLFDAGHEYAYRTYAKDGYDAVAKLDGYFYVPEDTTIESGIPGETITLARGWWSKEYKTKAAEVPREEWVREWASKRQADFQILALQEHLRSDGLKEYTGDETAQGVLVCVLEKPRRYIPKRKCKECGGQFELATFLPDPDGHRCPMCGYVQKLKPYEPKVEPRPEFWRVPIVRTELQLAMAGAEIIQIAEQMELMRREGPASFPPNRDNCYTNRWHRPCEFAEPHVAGREVEAGTEFVQVEDPLRYVGLGV